MCPTRLPTGESEEGAPSDFGLPSAVRVRRGAEIRRILDRGKRERTSSLDVFSMPSPVARPRFGLVVPKHRHTIVDRNLVKRRLREIGRLEVLPRLREAGVPMDVLVRARREAYGADFDGLKQEIVRVVEGLCSAGC